jgi:hypothetical protein
MTKSRHDQLLRPIGIVKTVRTGVAGTGRNSVSAVPGVNGIDTKIYEMAEMTP